MLNFLFCRVHTVYNQTAYGAVLTLPAVRIFSKLQMAEDADEFESLSLRHAVLVLQSNFAPLG